MILVYVGHMEDDMNIPRPSPCCLGMKARLDSTVIINTSELSALSVLQIVLEPISNKLIRNECLGQSPLRILSYRLHISVADLKFPLVNDRE